MVNESLPERVSWQPSPRAGGGNRLALPLANRLARLTAVLAHPAEGVAGAARGRLAAASRKLPTSDPGKRQAQNRPILCAFSGSSCRGLTCRELSYSTHQPSVGTYVDAQQGWLYVYTNFNSVRFSTSPAVELTMAVG